MVFFVVSFREPSPFIRRYLSVFLPSRVGRGPVSFWSKLLWVLFSHPAWSYKSRQRSSFPGALWFGRLFFPSSWVMEPYLVCFFVDYITCPHIIGLFHCLSEELQDIAALVVNSSCRSSSSWAKSGASVERPFQWSFPVSRSNNSHVSLPNIGFSGEYPVVS